jgi:phosphoglycolate phosphatase
MSISKQNGRFENILFDLDGTLTNPKVGIVNSILYALEKLSIIETNIDELETFIGPPLRESFVTRYNLTESSADLAMNYYREYFSAKGLYENEVYSDIPALLEVLFANKYKLFVATSKPTLYAEKIVEHFNLNKYIVKTIGSNLDNTRTDKSEVISHVISTYGLQTANSVMIGDRKFDIIGAKNNSIKSIGVTYGYGTLEELQLHKPDFIVNNCDEIKAILLN